MKLKPLAQQVVVVFGASSGIGRETARQFAQRGAKLVIAARTRTALESLAEEIRSKGGEVAVIEADTARYEDVQAVADLAITQFGRLDTWVHAAATAIIGRFEQTTPEEFKRVIEVDLLGQIYGAKAALPHLKREGRGALIHISSVEARRALPLQSAYAASKHGIEGFVESLRVELAYDQIPVSVTSIMPSVINTPFYNKARTKLGVKPTAVPPFYPPSLVAEAILYAAEHPTRDIIVGDVGKIVDFLQRLSPALLDRLLTLIGIPAQRSDVPEAEGVDDNLYDPIEGYGRAEGDYGNQSLPSFLDVFDKNPVLRTLATGATLAAVTLLVGRAFGNKQQ